MYKGAVWQIFRVPEVLYNIFIMCGQDLPDMCALTLRHCAPSGLCVHIRQLALAYVTYITCIYISINLPTLNLKVY